MSLSFMSFGTATIQQCQHVWVYKHMCDHNTRRRYQKWSPVEMPFKDMYKGIMHQLLICLTLPAPAIIKKSFISTIWDPFMFLFGSVWFFTLKAIKISRPGPCRSMICSFWSPRKIFFNYYFRSHKWTIKQTSVYTKTHLSATDLLRKLVSKLLTWVPRLQTWSPLLLRKWLIENLRAVLSSKQRNIVSRLISSRSTGWHFAL